MRLSLSEFTIGFAADMQTMWLLRRVGERWLFVHAKKRSESLEDFGLRCVAKISQQQEALTQMSAH